MSSPLKTTTSAPNTDHHKLSDRKPRSKVRNKADPGPSASLCPGCLKAGGYLASEQGGRGPGSPGQVRASVFLLFLKLPPQADLDQNSFNVMVFRPAFFFLFKPHSDRQLILSLDFLFGGWWWYARSQLQHVGSSSLSRDQSPGHLHWERAALATGPPVVVV